MTGNDNIRIGKVLKEFNIGMGTLVRKREVAKKILNQDRCDYVCPADYSPGKNLDTLVKGIICKIKADDDLKKLKVEFKKKGYR